MAAQELARWTRFAAKGGVGRCTATVDCVAREIGDLMFLKVSMSWSIAIRFLVVFWLFG
jgi:hypothetical protein